MGRSESITRRSFLGIPLAFAVQQIPNLNELPPNLPVPKDDGGARHLSKVSSPRVIVYAYPRTGEPGKPSPAGWDDIPGARGCTPETCGFRDHHKDLAKLHAEVFGISTQSTAYQQEMVKRLEVPFEVLSDEQFALTNALRLPTFTVEGMRLLKRLTLVVRNHRIEHVFYPVFPPDKHAEEVIAWLENHPIIA
jgi:peroxiredoxin